MKESLEEIWVYHSIWKTLLTILVGVLFTVSSIIMLIKGKTVVLAWLSILFFGGSALVMLYLLLKQLITHRPYMIIGDQSVRVFDGKGYEVSFADVEDFFIASNDTIGIHYKNEVEATKMEEASTMERIVRKLNKKVSGSQETMTASGLTIKPKVLCAIMNERLQLIKKHGR
ncbi:MAG: hypothetical protein K5683_04305 [Prevotella sp.]|nr:hypothetical protein [Prevotella sp.]